jgi:hypothetical protein
MHAKDDPPSVAPHSKSKYPRQKIKESLSQESKLCYVQMRLKRPQFISSYDL